VTDAEQFDVIVVGCSTTGLALAKSLAAAGVRIAAVDRWPLAPQFDRDTQWVVKRVNVAPNGQQTRVS
jgi:2-polyprenyl-6-methoxyphenol hydroxylase-like FAD-dependent oxidoreductase